MTKEKEIRCLKVAPGEPPEECAIVNELESLQEAIDGFIEFMDIEAIDDIEHLCYVSVLCNEEGKINGMPGNRKIGRDIICGTFYVVAITVDGNLASLPEKFMEKYAERFKDPEYYTESEIDSAMLFEFYDLGGIL